MCAISHNPFIANKILYEGTLYVTANFTQEISAANTWNSYIFLDIKRQASSQDSGMSSYPPYGRQGRRLISRYGRELTNTQLLSQSD